MSEFKFSYFSIPAGDETAFGFPNGVKVYFQKDGNFVAYKPGGVAVAATASNSEGADLTLIFQEDGNLVVYSHGKALWASDTGGVAKGADLVIKDSSPYMQIVGKDGKVFYTANEK
ncbi:hypothetical protein SCHPADRAFT_893391 [Schizopora paradoxa]|uniref:Bulb-type lectin domain-containing protein n=1 Tax=Schizopora paradoxa TaxID=27342 RepID=A0A0H2RB47_9AGAM|nr:hypothetical protein SCHPADRAFT_893391 [Schizopora paradoxa]